MQCSLSIGSRSARRAAQRDAANPQCKGYGSGQSAPQLEVTNCDFKMRSQMTTPTDLPAKVTHASRASVHEIRRERVVLDYEVARLFGVETRKLNRVEM
jgi:hypothetical protein